MYHFHVAHVEETDPTGKRREGYHHVLKDEQGNTIKQQPSRLLSRACVVSTFEVWCTQADINARDKFDGALEGFHHLINGHPTESTVEIDISGIRLKFRCMIDGDYLRGEREKFPILKAAVKQLVGP